MLNLMKRESKGDAGNVERTRNETTYSPRFDIFETEDELTLYGDLPGVAPEDLDVRFENEHVIVHGRVGPRNENREFLFGEYDVGDFYREFRVNETIDLSGIEAELKNGVLTLHLPKAEAIKPKRIEVRSE